LFTDYGKLQALATVIHERHDFAKKKRELELTELMNLWAKVSMVDSVSECWHRPLVEVEKEPTQEIDSPPGVY
jgi:hypothetical protein